MSTGDLGTARGSITINVSRALASYAELRAAHSKTMGSLSHASEVSKKVGLGFLGAAGVLGAGFALAAKASAEFEKKMSFFGAVTNATKQDMDVARAAALKFGTTTAFSANQVADAFVELGKAGISTKDIVGGVAQATFTLASAADISTQKAAETIVQIKSTYHLAASDATHIADVLAGAANASIIDVDDLATSFKYAGSAAATLGISLDDTATALAILGNAGIRGSTAGTSLRRILLNLTPPTKTAANAMQALGIITKDGSNLFYDAAGNAKDLATVSQILQDHTRTLTQEQKVQYLNQIFGNRAISSAIILAEGGAKAFKKYADAVHSTTALEVMNKRLDNLGGSLQKFKAAFGTVLVQAGAPAQKPLKGLVDSLAGVVKWFGRLPPATQANISKLVLFTALALGAVGALTLLVSVGLKAIEMWRAFGLVLGLTNGALKGAIIGSFQKLGGAIQTVRLILMGAGTIMQTTMLGMAAAAAILVGALILVKLNIDRLKKANDNGVEAANKLSDSIGKGTLTMQQFANANANAISQLRKLDAANQKAYLVQIGVSLKQSGMKPSDVFESLKKLAGAAGIEMPIGLNAKNVTDIKQQLESIRTTAERVFKEIDADWLGMGTATKETLSGMAQEWAKMFTTGGQAGVESAVRSLAAFQDTIGDTTKATQAQQEAINYLTDEFAKYSGVQNLNIDKELDMKTALEDMTSAQSSADEQTKSYFKSILDAKTATNTWADAIAAVGTASMPQLTEAQQKEIDKLNETKTATDNVKKSYEDLDAQVKAMTNTTLNLQASTGDAIDSARQLAESVKKQGYEFESTTKVGRANLNLARNLSGAFITAADSAVKWGQTHNKTETEVAARIVDVRNKLIAQMIAAGATKKEADRLAKAYLGLPKRLTTLAKLNAGGAFKTAADLKYALSLIKDKTVRVNIEQHYNAVRAQNAYTDFLNARAKAAQGHATGGWVNGMGTGTSDSNVRMLSNREFVVNSAAARVYGPLLEAINAGRGNAIRSSYISGGVPGGRLMASSGPAAGPDSRPVNIVVQGPVLPEKTSDAVARAGRRVARIGVN